MIKRRIDYPPCQFLDPNIRDGKGHLYCERHHIYVIPTLSFFNRKRGINLSSYFNENCASDCPHRAGKTRRATV